MAVKKILLLGNPCLYKVCKPVQRNECRLVEIVVQDLHDTIMEFKLQNGFGRAIAAPQIGVNKRLVYMYVDQPVVFINPVFGFLSDEMIALWDDCMSFPDLLVKVRRHQRCRIYFQNESWEEQEMELNGSLSELLQHEVDHLDGILAIQRAVDSRSIVIKSQRKFL